MTEWRNPMRCGAKTRGDRAGRTCRAFPVRGGHRCRMHGGKGSGRSPTHGRRTKRAEVERRETRRLIAESRRTIALVGREIGRSACRSVPKRVEYAAIPPPEAAHSDAKCPREGVTVLGMASNPGRRTRAEHILREWRTLLLPASPSSDHEAPRSSIASESEAPGTSEVPATSLVLSQTGE
jgi:hypothetical protein